MSARVEEIYEKDEREGAKAGKVDAEPARHFAKNGEQDANKVEDLPEA